MILTDSKSTNPLNLQTFLDSIDYRVARTKEEIEKAYYLVYREYLIRGYTNENVSKLRISVFNALPAAATFIAIIENEVLATATVIPDSLLGLPMDELYQKELDEFRKENKKLCEISMLASNTELFKGGISMMLNSKKLFLILCLFKTVLDYTSCVLNLDYMCITINPKHKLTYDFLLFKDFGELKTYDYVNGAPAIAKYFDIKSAEEECKKQNRQGLYKMFYSRKTDPDKLSQKITFTTQDLKYFFVEKTDIFKGTPPAKLNYIKESYPDYDFSQILT